MIKKTSRKLLMAALMIGLISGLGACSKKASSENTGMDQNDQAEAVQPAEKEQAYTPAPSQDVSLGEDIHFDFDRSAITPKAADILKSKAKTLSDNPEMEVTIEGHCDDRGTNEYNMALGDRRAQSARDFLVQLGIEGSRLNTVSFGEENPLIPDAKNESEHSKNRRAHFRTGGIVAVSPVQPDEMTQEARAAETYHYSKIDTLPFVRDSEIESLGYIFDKRKEENVLIAEGAEVYIKADEGKRLVLGNQYMVYTPMKPLKNREGDIIGIPHRVNGVVEIVRQEKHHAVAKVIKSYWEFKEGNKIAPYKKRSPYTTYVDAPKGIDGDIIMGAFDDVMMAQNQIVFIDKGKNQGLKPGQRYNIYRDLVVPPDTSDDESTTSPIEYGKILVLDSGENASSAIVLSSEKDVDPWQKYKSPK